MMHIPKRRAGIAVNDDRLRRDGTEHSSQLSFSSHSHRLSLVAKNRTKHAFCSGKQIPESFIAALIWEFENESPVTASVIVDTKNDSNSDSRH